MYFIIKRSGKSQSQDFATKSTINNVKLLSNCKRRQHVKGIVAVYGLGRGLRGVSERRVALETALLLCESESSQRCALALQS